MPSILTNNISVRNASDLVESIRADFSSFYIFYGRTYPWPDEQNPPIPENTVEEEYRAWHDMTAMKRIDFRDTSLGFRRVDWTSGTVYDEYRHDTDLSSITYFVFTDENKVYKCISNNNGSPSTVKPTHTITDITEKSDGYKWKYMFTLSDSLYRKFFAPGYLPVTTDETVVNNAIDGSIENMYVVTSGSGYTSNSTIPVYVDGDGDENATARATITVDANGSIVDASSAGMNPGSDYPYAPDSNIPIAFRQVNTTTGANQTAYGTANTNAEGQIQDVSVVIGGSGYFEGQCQIVQSSCKGLAETDASGAVVNTYVDIGKSGKGFRKAKATVIGSSTTPAEVKPIISPRGGHGANPESELLCRYALLNLRFAYEEGEGDFTVGNDFRRIGLLYRPLAFGSNTDEPTNTGTLDAKYRLILDTSNVSFSEDETIIGQTSGARGLQIDLLDDNILRVVRDDEISNSIDFQIGETVRGSNSGELATITDIVHPEVELYSGQVLFINNREPIDRSSDQIESITLVMEY